MENDGGRGGSNRGGYFNSQPLLTVENVPATTLSTCHMLTHLFLTK